MPIGDIDIWRAAQLLMKQHGADAALIAAQRADELLGAGDIEGQIVWKQIAKTVGELMRSERHSDEPLN